MKYRHVWGALLALALLALGLSAFEAYARSVERSYVHAAAPRHLMETVMGSALADSAAAESDLLLVFGASETIEEPSSYQESVFFHTYPTGFETFDVAVKSQSCIVIAQRVASMGPALRGKKVVISFSPSTFTLPQELATPYDRMFSDLQANRLAFSPELSFETRHLAAQRMLQYPTSLKQDVILRMALQQLANGSPLSQANYAVLWPLGRLHILLLEIQDHYAALRAIQRISNLSPDVKRSPASLDWESLAAKARLQQTPKSNNNPFGFDNQKWTKYVSPRYVPMPAGSQDARFHQELNRSKEWTDLDILLRILKEEGAQVLILSRPESGAYYDATGISATARQEYYNRLEALGAQYGAQVVDFRAHDEDRFFGVDPSPHTAMEGWVYVDQVLDEYYHGPLH